MKLSTYFSLGGDQGFALPDTVQLAAKLKVFFCCFWSATLRRFFWIAVCPA
jgi:hypothetical protein